MSNYYIPWLFVLARIKVIVSNFSEEIMSLIAKFVDITNKSVLNSSHEQYNTNVIIQ